MPKGIIKYFNDVRGYGFIQSTMEQSIFVHHSKIRSDGYRTLREGEEVLFELKRSSKGLEAVNVQKT